LYGLSALGGSVVGFLLAPTGTLSVGASGAIFGLFGAYYVVVRRLGGPTGSILGLLAVNLVITFTVPFIDWRAHLGGLVTGTLLALAFAYVPRSERRDLLQGLGCAAVAIVLFLLVLLRRAAVGV
jgi:membrane associated rhomboid family serine protease